MKNISDIRKSWFLKQVEKLKLSGVTYVEIANKLDVKPQYLTPIIKGDRGAAEKFVLKFCEVFDINHNDLLQEYKTHETSPPQKVVESQADDGFGIPLIPIEPTDYPSKQLQRESVGVDRYNVPEFNMRGVRYLVRYYGSSMYPKYITGDLLACRPVKDLNFFQYGKVYVLDTEQGAIVKRLYEGKSSDFIECRSDNKDDYPTFQIPKTSIKSLAIVVGVIRVE